MAGGQNSKSTGTASSDPISGLFPGIYGGTDYQASSGIMNQLMAMLSSPGNYKDVDNNIPNLNASPQTAAEQNLVNQVMDVANAQNASTIVGSFGGVPSTSLNTAAAIAPTMYQFGRDRIGDWLNKRQGDIAIRGQDIAARGQDVSGLQEAAYAAMPTPWLSSTSRSREDSKSKGANCCFIFIEAYDGRLLDIVRRYRDEKCTVENRRGYYRLADVLVPMMKKYKSVKNFVRVFMTSPMVSYGKFYYGEGKLGIIFKPVAWAWLKIFDKLGHGKKYVRSNGEVI